MVPVQVFVPQQSKDDDVSGGDPEGGTNGQEPGVAGHERTSGKVWGGEELVKVTLAALPGNPGGKVATGAGTTCGPLTTSPNTESVLPL